jgi:hypothetical protein
MTVKKGIKKLMCVKQLSIYVLKGSLSAFAKKKTPFLARF